MTADRRLARRAPVAFKPNWFDRLLVQVAPRWGANRLRARALAAELVRHYDAAGGGRRSSGWQRYSSDANTANLRALTVLRELSRDLHRNNVYARRAVQIITNNTIGWGIEPKIVGKVPDELASRAMEVWDGWADSPRCDFDGRMTFYGLERLVLATVVNSGEALVLRQPAATKDRLPVPTRVQVLEPDYLDTAKDGIRAEGGGPIVQGVEYDNEGRRVAYWLFYSHPGSASPGSLGARSLVSRRVPAENVLHIFCVERPGQARGVPWPAANVSRLNDYDDFEDASLMQQKIAASFTAFVKNLDGGPTTAENIGRQNEVQDQLEELAPGHISYLRTGQEVQFPTMPAAPDPSFATRNLRGIAVGYGVSYEELSGDYSQVNFSSARMARLSHWANVHVWRWDTLIPQFCAEVWRWVMEEAAMLEGWPLVPAADWVPPPMPMIEPDKEGLAYTRLVRGGFMSFFNAIRERGEDPEKHLAEVAAGNKKLDELGIVLDSDPRRTSSTGQAQQLGGKPGKPGAASGADEAGKDKDEEDDESEDVDLEDESE